MANETAKITSQDAYQPGSAGPPLKPGSASHNESVKIRDAGKNTAPGQDATPAPFVDPNPRGMLGIDWDKASR